MNRRFLGAVLAGSATLLPVGFLLYGVVFSFLFEEGALLLPGVMRQSPSVAWIIAGQVGFGTLVALVISWRGKESLTGGAQTGAILGFLMAVGYDFAQFGTSNLWSLEATLADPFITAALVGASGASTGWVLGRRS
ncbi:MAG: hypothetical protein HKN72_10270 [Gemmatimonadetes bacterium]|nr:hypothetical protein [Gemmatimonadota bacterium]NNF13602.1 hypothetical protein [Gemmatimonadota bacterium]